jgi:hypothetical protein
MLDGCKSLTENVNEIEARINEIAEQQSQDRAS